MSENAWLTIVIGSAAVLAVVAVGLVLRIIRPTAARQPGATASAVSGSTPLLGHRRRSALRWGTYRSPRRRRSVEDNLARAYDRIDKIDPYVVQHRIGSALAQVGLVSSPSVFDEPAPSSAPPSNRARSTAQASGAGGSSGEADQDRGQRWEDEA